MPGVRVVVDAGLSRVPRTDLARGLGSLVTVRVSRASVTQRAGRAGREAPGAVYRCWSAAEHERLPAHAEPEVAIADLTAFALELACWGAPGGAGPRRCSTRLPPAALLVAGQTLRTLGAVDDDGRVTARGRALTAVGVHPRLARALLDGAPLVGRRRAAEVVALLSADARPSAATTWPRPGGTCARACDRGATARWRDEVARLERAVARRRRAAGLPDDLAAGLVVGLAHPERLARRRPGGAGTYLMAAGTGAELAPGRRSPGAPWLAVAVADRAPGRRDARVRSAVADRRGDRPGGRRPRCTRDGDEVGLARRRRARRARGAARRDRAGRAARAATPTRRPWRPRSPRGCAGRGSGCCAGRPPPARCARGWPRRTRAGRAVAGRRRRRAARRRSTCSGRPQPRRPAPGGRRRGAARAAALAGRRPARRPRAGARRGADRLAGPGRLRRPARADAVGAGPGGLRLGGGPAGRRPPAAAAPALPGPAGWSPSPPTSPSSGSPATPPSAASCAAATRATRGPRTRRGDADHAGDAPRPAPRLSRRARAVRRRGRGIRRGGRAARRGCRPRRCPCRRPATPGPGPPAWRGTAPGRRRPGSPRRSGRAPTTARPAENVTPRSSSANASRSRWVSCLPQRSCSRQRSRATISSPPERAARSRVRSCRPRWWPKVSSTWSP